MRNFLFIAFLFCSSLSFAKPAAIAKGLPEHYDTRNLTLAPVGVGHSLKMNCEVKIPFKQDLNRSANSYLDVYENDGDKWTKIASWDLRKSIDPIGEIHIDQPLTPKSDNSRLAVDATVYHCSADHSGPCVIESFQGIIKRSKNASLVAQVKIAGSMPHYAK